MAFGGKEGIDIGLPSNSVKTRPVTLRDTRRFFLPNPGWRRSQSGILKENVVITEADTIPHWLDRLVLRGQDRGTMRRMQIYRPPGARPGLPIDRSCRYTQSLHTATVDRGSKWTWVWIPSLYISLQNTDSSGHFSSKPSFWTSLSTLI